MSAQLAMLVSSERKMRWLRGAAWFGFATCDGCGQTHDPFTGQRLLVARQPRCRKRLCLSCWARNGR